MPPSVMASSSATTVESQTPSISMISGNNKTNEISKTIVRIKEMTAETIPLFSAVKNEELKIANPENKKLNEKMRNPLMVNCIKLSSYPAKIKDIG